MEHVIDASNKSLGRVASVAAAALRGKNSVSFSTSKIPADNTVIIKNAKLVRVTGNKREEKQYLSYSGYPGGLSKLSMDQLAEKKGNSELLRRAITRMLPRNKLRPLLMKTLTVEE